MLVALELAGWLNEANLALQAVVQCYGLLAPLIHFQIPALPVVQVSVSNHSYDACGLDLLFLLFWQ